MTDVAGPEPVHHPTPSRKAQAERYNRIQAETCQQIDHLLQQTEAVLTTKQFDEARTSLWSIYRLIGRLTALRNRRGGKPRQELTRLVRYYSLYQRSLVGAVSAANGAVNAAKILLPLSYRQAKQLKADYPKSPEIRQLTRKISSWQKLIKHPDPS